MTTQTLSPIAPEIDIFAPEADAAWKALNSRFADRLSMAELDHLYALFIFGLTSPSYVEREPTAHLEICRALLERKLPPDRIHNALHAVPQPVQPWLASAFEAMERRGTETGLAIARQNRIEETSEADARAASPSHAELSREKLL